MSSKSNNVERTDENGLLANELNRGIIRALRADGRVALSEIAQTLNVSKGTIRNRVAAMKNAGVFLRRFVGDGRSKHIHRCLKPLELVRV